ncbi:MAG: NAD(P)-binding protein [Thermoplasmatales archaeon]
MKALEPGIIRNVKTKNRIVMAPMIYTLANQDGSSNDVIASYLAERAKGGAGIIITEYTYIDNINSRGSRNQLGAYSFSLVPKLKRITEGIHNFGALAFMQLVHAGGKALWGENAENPMAPSSVDYLGKKPREMKKTDIDRVIDAFANAAKVARYAGFDGVEIHGAHGYLIHQFLSPTLNLRCDEYGGSFEKRLKFPQDVIDAIRETGDFPVGIRLSLYEDDPRGWSEEYGLKVAESLKGIDYVHFSAGNFYPPGSSASFYSPRTHILERLHRRPGITTMLVGSITSREDVERVLSVVDYAVIGRGLLADPYLPMKLSEYSHLIRPCIRCNQACRDLSLGEVRCTVNPDVGREYEKIGRYSGEIVIIGGGLQGLEAAVFASKIVLKVTLYEKEDRLGGQLNKIYDPFKKLAFQPLIRYYENALKFLGVDVTLNSSYNGQGILCLPPINYPKPPDSGETFLSNVYANHDEFLRIADVKKIRIGVDSLNSLDRARKIGYSSLAKEKGIEIGNFDSYDFSLMVEKQYDIWKAINLGRTKVKELIMVRGNEFL